MSLICMSGGFSDSDKASTLVYKLPDCRRYRRIFPRCSAGMRCIPVTYIDDDIDFL